MEQLGRCASVFMLCLFLVFGFSACSRTPRTLKDIKSGLTGGLNSHVTVFTADGEVLAEYDGKIDIRAAQAGGIEFECDGKRITYYNCYIEVKEN